MSPYRLTNFEIQKYYLNESGNNLPEIKDGAFLVNLDEYKLIGTHWIALCVNGNNVICSDSLFEHISKEIHRK